MSIKQHDAVLTDARLGTACGVCAGGVPVELVQLLWRSTNELERVRGMLRQVSEAS